MSELVDPGGDVWDVGTDTPVTLDVVVEQTHIDAGRPSDCARCPIALALLAACEREGWTLSKGDGAKVYGDHVQLTQRSGPWYVGVLSAQAREFIRCFDHGPASRVNPFSFPLALHEVVQQPEDQG